MRDINRTERAVIKILFFIAQILARTNSKLGNGADAIYPHMLEDLKKEVIIDITPEKK